ncbi:hypothetical protein GCM10022221_72400 [Actinocorallia aurea]
MLGARDPEEVGGYRLLGRLGEGGQGVVYLGEGADGEKVAVKVLHGGAAGDFRREVAAARRVAPFCTARILEAGDDFVVSEFIEGPSLRQAVEGGGPLGGSDLYRLAVGTATALAAIHDAGVVHRDFKPGNVLLGPGGPRVIDFGIARSADATVSVTASIIGTPAYMAPEQFATRAVTAAADVFAWAATIAYAATGRPPFGQDSLPLVMHRVVTGEPDLGRIGGALRRLLVRCTAKDPAARPTAREILAGLLETSAPDEETLVLGREAAASTPADEARTARWTALTLTEPRGRRAPRWLPTVAAAVVGVVVAGGVGFAVIRSQDEPARTSASGRPTASAGTEPEDAKGFAAFVTRAVDAAGTASVEVSGGRTEGLDQMESEGRLEVESGAQTSFDVTVSRPEYEVGDPARNPARMILIGQRAYYRSVGASEAIAATREAYGQGDGHLDVLLETRWMSCPRLGDERPDHQALLSARFAGSRGDLGRGRTFGRVNISEGRGIRRSVEGLSQMDRRPGVQPRRNAGSTPAGPAR